MIKKTGRLFCFFNCCTIFVARGIFISCLVYDIYSHGIIACYVINIYICMKRLSLFFVFPLTNCHIIYIHILHPGHVNRVGGTTVVQQGQVSYSNTRPGGAVVMQTGYGQPQQNGNDMH